MRSKVALKTLTRWNKKYTETKENKNNTKQKKQYKQREKNRK